VLLRLGGSGPARNCVEELAKRADALQKQGVTILAVQEPGLDAGKLKTWMEKSNIAFPVGVLTGDPDEGRVHLGRSVPGLADPDRQRPHGPTGRTHAGGVGSTTAVINGD